VKIRLTKEDIAFSKMIRDRDGWTCQYCGHTREAGFKIECAHIFGRRDALLRCEPDNALALCFKCHAEMHAHPAVFVEFVQKHLGMERFERLADIHNRRRDRV
jgi:hypothetical protein